MLRYVFLLCAVSAFAADLTILPGSVVLDGPEAYEQLLAEASVEGHQCGGAGGVVDLAGAFKSEKE